MTAYLDYNIYTSIVDGDYTLQKLLGSFPSINKIYYSASHVQEVYNITAQSQSHRKELMDRKLLSISEITQNHYLYHEQATNKMHYLIEDPFIVLETISEFPFAQRAMNSFMNLATKEEKEMFRIMMGVDIKKLNNYNPEDVITHLNTHLSELGSGTSFIEMIEMAMNSFPKDGTYGLANRMAAVFELLDFMGYWKDRETPTSNYARLWDSSHAYYASYCNYYISDDKRNRNKAKVVYDIYQINTQIVSSTNDIF